MNQKLRLEVQLGQGDRDLNLTRDRISKRKLLFLHRYIHNFCVICLDDYCVVVSTCYAQMCVVAALLRWRKLETGGKSLGDIITLTTDIGDMGESRGRGILIAASLVNYCSGGQHSR